MMYNPQLETFICVVDSGSFSKAAEKLYITPPALESSLALKLFERTHRGWSEYVDVLRVSFRKRVER